MSHKSQNAVNLGGEAGLSSYSVLFHVFRAEYRTALVTPWSFGKEFSPTKRGKNFGALSLPDRSSSAHKPLLLPRFSPSASPEKGSRVTGAEKSFSQPQTPGEPLPSTRHSSDTHSVEGGFCLSLDAGFCTHLAPRIASRSGKMTSLPAALALGSLPA